MPAIGQLLVPTIDVKMVSSTATDNIMDFDAMWEEAERSFEAATNRKLAKHSTSIKDIMSRLETKYGPDKAESHSKTKNAVRNIVKNIEVFGGIAIQGATMVFGPAQLCFNCVSFLLDIGKQIDKTFSSVGDLFEVLSDYLQKFDILKRIEKITRPPLELLESTHRVMLKFVDVCALAYALAFGQKREKLKTALKIVFTNEDSPVSTAVEQFNELVKKQDSIVLSLNYENTVAINQTTQQMSSNLNQFRKDVNEGMDTLVSAENTRMREKESKDVCTLIAKGLQIPDDVIEEQKQIFEDIKPISVLESRAELEKNPEYQKWKNFRSDAKHTLLISGESSSGKTYLMRAINDSMKDPETNPELRVVVARYFFRKENERSLRQKSRGSSALELAIKHISLQIAEQNMAYAKEVTNIIKDPNFGKREARDLWTRLFLSQPRGGVVHTVIFDGLDQLSDDDARILLDIIESQSIQKEGLGSALPDTADSGRSRIRTLLTSTPESFDRIISPTSILDTMPKLDAAELNASNIKSVIEQEIKRVKPRWGDTPKIQLLIKFIKDELPNRSRGDFEVVNRALESVDKAVTSSANLEDAQRILCEACEKDRTAVAAATIQALSNSLDFADIERLNILLMWVMFAPDKLTPEQLRAACFLETGSDPCQSFETILTRTYEKIFYINSSRDVGIVSDIEDYLRDNFGSRNPHAGGFGFSEQKITMEIKIVNAPVSQVRRFLWNLNERTHIEPFLFEDTSARDKVIEVYSTDALVHITLKLLALLNEDEDEMIETLYVYAVSYVNNFLRELFIMRDTLEPMEIKSILSGIITFLTDTEPFVHRDIYDSEIRFSWIDGQQVATGHIIREWLTYEKAVTQLDRKDRRRLNDLLDDKQGYLSFYKPFTRTMAKRWLQSMECNIFLGFNWIDWFIDSQNFWSLQNSNLKVGEDGTSEDETLDASDSQLTKAQRIERALAWAKTNLPHYEEDSLWFQRLGLTYWTYFLDKEAIEQYEQSKSLSSTNWRSYTGCATAWSCLNNTKRAIEELSKGIDIMRTESDLKLTDEDGDYLTEVRRLIEYYLTANMLEEALDQCHAALEQNPHAYSVHMLLLRVATKRKDATLTKTHLIETLTQESVTPTETRLVGFLRFAAKLCSEDLDLAPFDQLMISASEVNSSELILQALRQLSQEKKANNEIDDYCALQLFESCILTTCAFGSDARNFERAIKVCEDVLQLDIVKKRYEDQGNIAWILRKMHRVLAMSYFHCMHLSTTLIGSKEEMIEKFEDLLRLSSIGANDLPEISAYLASYHVTMKRPEDARKILRGSMEESLDLLSDDEPDNDMVAFWHISRTLVYMQDNFNALAAWYLISPWDAHVEPFPEADSSNGAANGEDANAGTEGGEKTSGDVVGTIDNAEDAKDEATPNNQKAIPSNIGLGQMPVSPQMDRESSNKSISGETHVTDTSTLVDGVQSQIDKQMQPAQNEDLEGRNEGNASKTEDNLPVFIKISRYLASPVILKEKEIPWQYDPEDDQVVLIRQSLNEQQLDEISALSTMKSDSSSTIEFICDGRCGKKWFSAREMYLCRFCQGLFCPPCMNKVKSGTMKHIVFCQPEHDWMRLPNWSRAQEQGLAIGKVRVGGIIDEDGYLSGGQILTLQEWVRMLRKDWDLGEAGTAFNLVGERSPVEGSERSESSDGATENAE